MDRLETSKLDGSARVPLLEQVLHPFGLTQVGVVMMRVRGRGLVGKGEGWGRDQCEPLPGNVKEKEGRSHEKLRAEQ